MVLKMFIAKLHSAVGTVQEEETETRQKQDRNKTETRQKEGRRSHIE